MKKISIKLSFLCQLKQAKYTQKIYSEYGIDLDIRDIAIPC